MIKGLVFDLDHTLFDRYATLTEIAPLIYEEFSDKIAKGLCIEDVATTLIYADKEYNCFGFEEVVKYLNQSKFFCEYVSKEEYLAKLFEAFSTIAVPFDYTYDVLEKLKNDGYKLGLITNGSIKLQSKKVELLGIKGYFDIIYYADGKDKKPSPKPFIDTSYQMNIPTNMLLYVGDHPINDVEASRNAGYTPVWVKAYDWKYPDVKRCDYEIDTIEGIFEVIDKINNTRI